MPHKITTLAIILFNMAFSCPTLADSTYKKSFGDGEEWQQTKQKEVEHRPYKPQERRDFRRSRSMRKTEPSHNKALNLLPLGTGQYLRGSYVLGTFFASGQVAGIALYHMKTQEAADVTAQTEMEIKELVDHSESRENIEAFRTARQQYADDLNNQAMTYLGLAVATYAIGVAEAFINHPTGVEVSLLPSHKPDQKLALGLSWKKSF